MDMVIAGNLNYDYVVSESLYFSRIHCTVSLYNMSWLITENNRVAQSAESDHYVTFTELSASKGNQPVSQGDHKTTTCSNYTRSDESEVIAEIKGGKWSEWKYAVFTIL